MQYLIFGFGRLVAHMLFHVRLTSNSSVYYNISVILMKFLVQVLKLGALMFPQILTPGPLLGMNFPL